MMNIEELTKEYKEAKNYDEMKKRTEKMPKNEKGKIVAFRAEKFGKLGMLADKLFDEVLKEAKEKAGITNMIMNTWHYNAIMSHRNNFISDCSKMKVDKIDRNTGELLSYDERLAKEVQIVSNRLYGKENGNGGLKSIIENICAKPEALVDLKTLEEIKGKYEKRLAEVNENIANHNLEAYKGDENKAFAHVKNIKNKISDVNEQIVYSTPKELEEINSIMKEKELPSNSDTTNNENTEKTKTIFKHR